MSAFPALHRKIILVEASLQGYSCTITIEERRKLANLGNEAARPVFPALGSIHSTVLTSLSSNIRKSCTRKLDKSCTQHPFSFVTARSFLKSSLSTAKRDRHKPQDYLKLPTSSTTGSPSAFFSARSLFHWFASRVADHCAHQCHTFSLTLSTTLSTLVNDLARHSINLRHSLPANSNHHQLQQSLAQIAD